MKSLGLISQVLTIGLSIAIALLYIKPTFEEIGTIQTEIDQYVVERSKIEKVNANLSQHVAALASISQTNIDKIKTYMPEFVDDLAVLRDIQFIVSEAGMIFKNVEYIGISDSLAEGGDGESSLLLPTPHEFSVVVEGTYSQVKDFLSLLEQNHYPLEVHAMEITPLDGGFLTLSATLITYADDQDHIESNTN